MSDGARIVMVFLVILLIVAAIVGLFAVVPRYKVWQQGLAGEATLRRAEQERQVLVEQAKAEVDAAKLRAEAIQIVGQAAKDFPEYRVQEFIAAFGEALQDGHVQKIIFVPTEANIPIVQSPSGPSGN